MPNNIKIKKTESETLKTFQTHIPSIYFSNKGVKQYKTYTDNAEYIYRDLFKFPPKMFLNTDLIDFGAGTGENTIYLANWGAKCTLVEMNKLAQNISKKVFKKHAKSKKHKFINSSIFNYHKSSKLYDIVHCRGVLSHTAANKKAFKKISSFVKPGGYLIFGDPNKSGGFQNMLQRYAVYAFSKTEQDMIDASEYLFKEDIDRSYKAIPRTRKEIIYDRWVIQSQDDPSVTEVFSWMKECNLNFYSSYPTIPDLFFGNSIHHKNRNDILEFKNLFSLSELIWMMQTDEDRNVVNKVDKNLKSFSTSLNEISSYVANCNTRTKIDMKNFKNKALNLRSEINKLNNFSLFNNKANIFLNESVKFIKLVKTSDLITIRKFIKNTKYLFKGACGVRHVDFIAHKPKRD